MSTKPAPLLLSFRAAAEVLGVGKTYLYGLVDNGDLPYVQLGTEKRSMRKISVKALEEFIETKTEKAPQ